MQATEKKITYVAIELVDDNPFQPRQHYDQAYLAELAESIKVEAKGEDPGYGVKQAPPAREVDGRYQLAAGHCRKRAVLLAEGTLFPLVIEDLNDSDMRRIAAIENLQRQDMSHADTAQCYLNLLKEAGWAKSGDATQNEIAVGVVAKQIGKPAATIRDYVAFSRLDGFMQGMVDAGQLSFKVCRDLALLPWADRARIVRGLTKEGRSVAETEAAIKAAVKAKQQADFLKAQGMDGEALTLFDVAPVSPKAKEAHSRYTSDMQRVAAILAPWGDADDTALCDASALMQIGMERDRIKLIIATLQRMDKTLVTVQGQHDAATILGK